jgi:hypothetical protein
MSLVQISAGPSNGPLAALGWGFVRQRPLNQTPSRVQRTQRSFHTKTRTCRKKSGRLDLNQRPSGPQPEGNRCRCVPERPMRPNRPGPWTLWTHRTYQSVPKWYHGPSPVRIGGPIRLSLRRTDSRAAQLLARRVNARSRSSSRSGAKRYGTRTRLGARLHAKGEARGGVVPAPPPQERLVDAGGPQARSRCPLG